SSRGANPPIHRTSLDRKSYLAKRSDRAWHMIGRGHKQPPLARLWSGEMPGKFRVLERVARVAFHDQPRLRNAKAFEDLARVVGFFRSGIDQIGATTGIDDAGARIFARERRDGENAIGRVSDHGALMGL